MEQRLSLNPNKRISGLYAITPDCASLAKLLPLAEAVIAGGASVLQYRNKISAPHAQMVQALAALCKNKNVIFIVNDDLHLAHLADGVHLGKEDGDIVLARQQLGADKIIGVSCYDSLERAITAEQAGANYVAFGSMFDSSTKPQAKRASLELLRKAQSALHIPIVAIGGITLQNAQAVVSAGADAIAVINSVFAATDPCEAAHEFSNICGIYTDQHESKPAAF